MSSTPSVTATPSSTPATATTPTTTSFVVALYDYTGSTEQELSFKTGDNIELLENGNEWWKGKLNGLIGFFPSSYVQQSSPSSKRVSQVIETKPATREEEERIRK